LGNSGYPGSRVRNPLNSHAGGLLFYGVVSAQTERVLDSSSSGRAAEAMFGEVREDEPLLAEDLRVEAMSSLASRRVVQRDCNSDAHPATARKAFVSVQ
jgi:hypothetical protein